MLTRYPSIVVVASIFFLLGMLPLGRSAGPADGGNET